MDKNLILASISLDELAQTIAGMINTIPAKTEQPPEIISRLELCKRLGLSEPSVIRYEKKGKIPVIHIGSSCRYNWPKVVAALENTKKGKP